MKLSSLLIIAGAGLLQVNASPLRVLIVGPEGSLGLQAGSNHESVAHLHPKIFSHQSGAEVISGGRRGCTGARYRQKALEFSNSLRQAFGMPLIQTEFVHVHGGKVRDETIHILPFKPEDRAYLHPNPMVDGEPQEGHHRHHHHHHHNHPVIRTGHFPHQMSFLKRVHWALMTLGPWEGRAVAFVLGCGLGVLLRMFWVLAVVSYRAIKGEADDGEETQTQYTPVLNQLDAEEIFVAPPVYIVDEKAPLREELKAAEGETN